MQLLVISKQMHILKKHSTSCTGFGLHLHAQLALSSTWTAHSRCWAPSLHTTCVGHMQNIHTCACICIRTRTNTHVPKHTCVLNSEEKIKGQNNNRAIIITFVHAVHINEKKVLLITYYPTLFYVADVQIVTFKCVAP